MGMIHVYLLVMFLSVVSARSCTPKPGGKRMRKLSDEVSEAISGRFLGNRLNGKELNILSCRNKRGIKFSSKDQQANQRPISGVNRKWPLSRNDAVKRPVSVSFTGRNFSPQPPLPSHRHCCRETFGGKWKGSFSPVNNKIVFVSLPTTQRKFQNKWASGIIVIRSGSRRPNCKADDNMVPCPRGEGRQWWCMALNKTANGNDCTTTGGTSTTGTPTDTVNVNCLTTTMDLTWKVVTGSRVKGNAYVTVQWRINTDVCNPRSQTLTVVPRGTCNKSTKRNETKALEGTSMEGTTFRGLQPYAEYLLTLTVTCAETQGKYCKSKILRTAESVPTAPPNITTVKAARDKYLIFKWNDPPCDEINGNITNYDFMFVKNEDQVHNVVPHGRRFVVFNGMKSSDSYSFQVRANTNRGFGIYSKLKTGEFGDLMLSSSPSDISRPT
ncbi:Roundabout-like 2 [Holothuria leucospilota]|uniref:Roundabout-like 2 n=1 Tax=Holothuria leucospilota TaxID=206669 RepID=A0A9Q1BNE6_HOLLE|nr:Roundabout-like 2 [Holothuria leucospilota]